MAYIRITAFAAVAATLMAVSGQAQAAFIATLSGNDCAGEFGQPFEACKIPERYDPNQSPVIAKYDYDKGEWEFNTELFPTVSAANFTISGMPGASGSWTYTPGPTDPLITFYVVKGGNFFNLFSNDGDPNSGDWFTPVQCGGGPQGPGPCGFSHITFYDTGRQVSEPMTLALLALGLFTGSLLMRRRGLHRSL